MGVYAELRGFALAHRRCRGPRQANAGMWSGVQAVGGGRGPPEVGMAGVRELAKGPVDSRSSRP